MASKHPASPSDSNVSLNQGMDLLHVNNNVSKNLTVHIIKPIRSMSDTVITPYVSFSDSVLSQEINELPESSFLKPITYGNNESDTGQDSQNESTNPKKRKRFSSLEIHGTNTAGDLATPTTSNHMTRKVRFS